MTQKTIRLIESIVASIGLNPNQDLKAEGPWQPPRKSMNMEHLYLPSVYGYQGTYTEELTQIIGHYNSMIAESKYEANDSSFENLIQLMSSFLQKAGSAPCETDKGGRYIWEMMASYAINLFNSSSVGDRN